MADRILNASVLNDDPFLSCDIYEPSTSWGHSIRADGPRQHSGISWHGIKAWVQLENMACQLYPGEGREQEQMEQLMAAARQLQAQVRRAR